MNYTNYVRDPSRDCAVAAHRGIWRNAPENSLPAIEAAIRAGCDIVEIDVRRSADGGLFLLHDKTLQRMAGIDEMPETLTSAQLAGLTLKNRDGGEGNEMTGERLPSLRDLFDLTRDRIFLHLDVKDRTVIPEVIACARDMGVAAQVDFWGSLRSAEDLAWVREAIIPHGVLFMAKSRIGALRPSWICCSSSRLMSAKSASTASRISPVSTPAPVRRAWRYGRIRSIPWPLPASPIPPPCRIPMPSGAGLSGPASRLSRPTNRSH
jgi:hypothetical protein